MRGSESGASDRTDIGAESTGGLGSFTFLHPAGSFPLTPASRISIRALARRQEMLTGTGIDWGTGCGCLAIVAARIPGVRRMIGLDIDAANVATARRNAGLNGVEPRVTFMVADSYETDAPGDREVLARLRSRLDFIIANPPGSDGDDGLGYCRRVLRGASRYLVAGGDVLVQFAHCYGRDRVEELAGAHGGFSYGGLVESSGPAPFDLSRPDLFACLEAYVSEEIRGGPDYTFGHGVDGPDVTTNAGDALAMFRRTGASPLSKWQVHRYVWRG